MSLLAKAHQVTGEQHYHEAALKKALLGVIPGQLNDGPRAGRWLDPHNARPAYHYIMMASLTRLAAALPADHTDRTAILHSLQLGLSTRNHEMAAKGVMNKDSAMECLLITTKLFRHDTDFLNETRTSAALDVLLRLASEEYRRGKLPLGPRSWGEMLEHLAQPKSTIR